MDSDVIIPVEVPQVGDDRHKNWAKVVTSVDVSRSTGWAFDGEFIATGGIQDVRAGSVIVVYGEKGSRANPTSHAAAFRAHPDGTVTMEGEAKGRAWARTLRDTVERLLEDDSGEALQAMEWQPDLMRYSDAALERSSTGEDSDSSVDLIRGRSSSTRGSADGRAGASQGADALARLGRHRMRCPRRAPARKMTADGVIRALTIQRGLERMENRCNI